MLSSRSLIRSGIDLDLEQIPGHSTEHSPTTVPLLVPDAFLNLGMMRPTDVLPRDPSSVSVDAEHDQTLY